MNIYAKVTLVIAVTNTEANDLDHTTYEIARVEKITESDYSNVEYF